MGVVRAQVFIPHDSGIPSDGVVNTFHFVSNDAPDPIVTAVLDDIKARLTQFYENLAPVGGASVNSLLSASLNQPLTTCKYYDMDAATPRAPMRTDTLVLSGTSPTAQLPAEIAICGSMAAPALSGVNQRRRRGRVFIGPLNTSAAETGNQRPALSARQIIASALDRLRTSTLTGPTAFKLAVYSRTNDVGGMSAWNSATPVSTTWVDDAWDVQRRRGLKPTSRYVRP